VRASASIETVIPTVYAVACRMCSLRSLRASEASEASLIASTGSTQGMRFRISPPIHA
jgi:hypothetical protein